ncbi:metallophosphoesterase [Intestinibacter bartlettii]|uniref:metallophosphoesterase n=1 Tax=Intestinibacter bartlettii TaxID=261299 RepID=UPI001D0297E6|nr:metallophosphoesterase [Intestinibacter bartlettii]MCB5746745.1 metallophosphoesterase [Intestinibacter bartlettii]MDU1252584.1 metallophosphoesterase [Peptostreptococcaceae bacterium]MDU2692854.1 metallophosphoesterase [Intestinibacter bartlettii]MDU6197429.1 metallophosphoesterase [Intestinibacter bartlettii]
MYKIIFIFIGIFILMYLYIKYNVNTLEVTKYVVENKKVPKEFDGYNIVQISDLHSKLFGENNKKLIQKIKSLNPDIVVVTGDLIDGENNNYNVALDFLKEISKLYRVYYIIGNHEQKSLIKKYKDEYKDYFNKLHQIDFVNLDNNKVEIVKGDSNINLYGLTVPYSCYKYLFDNQETTSIDIDFLEEKLGKVDREQFNILLAHTPFYFDEYEKWGADLTLCGHVHGGIVRLPIVGGLLSPDRKFFPKYDLGEYTKNKSTMIVSKGLGGSKVLIRVNCKPEIVNIKLKNIN